MIHTKIIGNAHYENGTLEQAQRFLAKLQTELATALADDPSPQNYRARALELMLKGQEVTVAELQSAARLWWSTHEEN
jgi:hypothetical protein